VAIVGQLRHLREIEGKVMGEAVHGKIHHELRLKVHLVSDALQRGDQVVGQHSGREVDDTALDYLLVDLLQKDLHELRVLLADLLAPRQVFQSNLTLLSSWVVDEYRLSVEESLLESGK